jgi:malate dehydrogenase (oxaloacetate-decarboxylating)
VLRQVMVADGLDPQEVIRRFWCLGRQGLLTDDQGDRLRDFQRPYARPAAEVAGWTRTGTGRSPSLADVVGHVHPTVLIGTSTQAGAFTEQLVRQMAAHVERPVIMPLSNPTSKAEAAPADLIAWTDGRALVATGSPFDPVLHKDITYRIAQANNALVFPGLGLGVAVARARRVSDRMLAAAADAVAGLSDATTRGAPLLPPVDNLREVSATVAVAVARAAAADGLAEVALDDPIQQVVQAMWQPEYPRAVNIAIGSSAQIALFVAPVLVLLSFVVGPFPMALVFNGFEIGAIFLAILVAKQVTQEGESTWFEGLQLLAVYAVLALIFYFVT